MVIFHSYVSLPEGTQPGIHEFLAGEERDSQRIMMTPILIG